MILNHWILGLLIGHVALLTVFTVGLLSAWQIFWGWDYNSTTEKQFALEKKTYLVSTIMSFAMATQILMLYFFVAAADEVAKILPGAMCPVGTLSSNKYGWPLLYIKIGSFFAYFLWLVINHLDNQVETYPLTRKKCAALMLIYPLPLLETFYLFLFALNLNPSVITSCCGTLFSAESGGLAGGLAALPPAFVLPVFFSVAAALLIWYAKSANWAKGRLGAAVEEVLWIAFFVVSIMAIISFICVYVYEMPAHKCPFCIMKPEYHYYGVILYIFLFGATATGIAAGMLSLFREPRYLEERAVFLRAKMQTVSVYGLLGFVIIGFLPFLIYYARTGRLI